MKYDKKIENKIQRKYVPTVQAKLEKLMIKDDQKTTLFDVHPELSKEWDYERNSPLTPETVTFCSGKKVWWKCSQNHSWQAAISHRSNGTKCPYCSGRLPIVGKTDLATLFPHIADEWDYDKNNPYSPSDYSAHSNKNVGWICSNGHTWDAKINNRTSNNNGCPYCTNHKVWPGFNDLATVNPELLKEWDYEGNGDLKPTEVTSGSNKNVWWKCQVCGNTWKASIANRTRGTGCSKCKNHGTSIPEQAIAFYLSQITEIEQRIKKHGEEIDVFLPMYNIGIEYDGSYFHQSEYKQERDKIKEKKLSSQNIILIRIQESDTNEVCSPNIRYKFDKLGANYEWALNQLCSLLMNLTNNTKFIDININIKRDYIEIRKRINLYHKERSLASCFPMIAKEWDYEKNYPLTPEQVYYGSTDYAFWKCPVCKNSWQEIINNRTGHNKLGCPYCSNHRVIEGKSDLATINPGLAKEWDFIRNKGLVNKKGQDISSPNKVAPSSNQKVWWVCSTCGHNWKAMICNRVKGRNCPICSKKRTAEALSKPKIGINDLASQNPKLAKEWDFKKNYPLTPELVASKANKKVWWICSSCGHEWQAIINNRSKGKGCPICGKQKSRAGKFKSVICVETETIYSSITEAEARTGIKRTSIGSCCKGKQFTAGGYHWKYYSNSVEKE